VNGEQKEAKPGSYERQLFKCFVGPSCVVWYGVWIAIALITQRLVVQIRCPAVRCRDGKRVCRPRRDIACEMDAFMTAVLLGMAWLDAFNANAETKPPDGEFA
jgi:hypothetical protein